MQQYRVRQVMWAIFEHDKPHPEDPNRRRLGGVQPRSGPKTAAKQLGKNLVERAQNRFKEIEDAAFAPLHPSNDPMDRHKAAMNLAKLEREERQMEIIEDDYARKTEDEVRGEAALLLLGMVKKGQINLADLVPDDDEIVEAEVVQQPQIGS